MPRGAWTGNRNRCQAMNDHPLCRQMLIDDGELQARLRFLHFGDDDRRQLEDIHRVIAEDAPGIIDEFYDNLMKFPPIAEFLADSDLRGRLKETQRNYLLTLGQGVNALRYFEDRLRIGVAHERVGLEQKWYLGAYSILFDIIARRLAQSHAEQPHTLAACLVTLQKILTLDSILAVETYYQATTNRLEGLLQQLNETQKRLQELARLDGLTGLNNRMYLMECLEKEVQRSLRFRRPLTLLFLDIDHFKNINDQFGHSAGDSVLKQVVQTIRTVIRPVDVIGRFGGEEFLVGLVETDESAARQVAERLRLKVAHTPFRVDAGPMTLTVSIGVATLVGPINRIEELIDQADRALYRAKNSGRDQVQVYSGEPLLKSASPA